MGKTSFTIQGRGDTAAFEGATLGPQARKITLAQPSNKALLWVENNRREELLLPNPSDLDGNSATAAATMITTTTSANNEHSPSFGFYSLHIV